MTPDQEIRCLTPRQKEVLGLMARGLTNGEIAETLGLSFATVKAHVSEVIGRLGVTSREQAIEVWRHERQPIRRLRRAVHVLLPFSLIIRTAAGAGLAAGAASAGIVLWHTLPQTEPAATLVVPASDLQIGVPRSYLVESLGQDPSGEPYPLWLVAHDDGSYSALLGRDPLSSCTVPWVPGYIFPAYQPEDGGGAPGRVAGFTGAFKANCSGEVFTVTGSIVFGASYRGLDAYEVQRQGEDVIVTFDRLFLGPCDDDLQPPGCSQASAPISVSAAPSPIIAHWQGSAVAVSGYESWPKQGNRNLWSQAWRIASQSQRTVLEDGEVTFDEYQAAAFRTVQCIDQAGELRGEAVFNPETQIYDVAARGAVPPGGDRAATGNFIARTKKQNADCYAEHWDAISQAWTAQFEPAQEFLDQARAGLGACLRDAGLDVPAAPNPEDFAPHRGSEAWSDCARSVGDMFGISSFDG